MDAPRVSVLIGAWNNAGTLPHAMQSMLDQTLGQLELLVLDDGSEDDTEAVVERVGDARVRYEKLPHRGIAATLNHGLEAARADIVAVLDADDWALPDRLRRQLEVLDARPDVAVVGCRTQELDDLGNELRNRTSFKSGDVTRALQWFNPIPNTASAFRRSAALDAGGYSGRYRYAAEYDLWLRIADRHRIWNLPDTLSVRVMHGANASASNERVVMRESLALQWATLRRRRSLRGVEGLAIPALSLATPTPLKRAARRMLGQAP
jgi:glycosyltransferase involved in cell wall biosynthesis